VGVRHGPLFGTAERQDGGADLANRKLQAGLDRSQRDAGLGGDLALAQTAEVGELQGLTLGDGKRGEEPLEDFRPVGRVDVFFDALVARLLWFVLGLEAQALFGAGISLTTADAINGAAAGKGDDPAQGLAFGFVVVIGAVPEFEENFLKKVIHIVLVVHDTGDDRAKERSVAPVESPQGGLVTGLDEGHKAFVGDVRSDEVFDLLVVKFVKHGGLIGKEISVTPSLYCLPRATRDLLCRQSIVSVKTVTNEDTSVIPMTLRSTHRDANSFHPSGSHELSESGATMNQLTKLAQKSGKIGYALLWLLGVPLPILLIVYLVRGH
jgi:hypothetical protein